MQNFNAPFTKKFLIFILLLLQGNSCNSGNSNNSGIDASTRASFLTDVQGDYRTVFREGGAYDVRVIVRNRKDNQSAFNEHLKDNPIEHYANESSVLKQFGPVQYPIEVLVQIGQYSNHFVYKEPAELDSPVILNYETGQQQLLSQFIYILEEEFFIGGVHFEEREGGRWILEKIVLWKTGFMIPLFKKKHYIGNFQKVF